MGAYIYQLLLLYTAIQAGSYLFLRKKLADIFFWSNVVFSIMVAVICVFTNAPNLLGVKETIEASLMLYNGIYVLNNILYSIFIPSMVVWFLIWIFKKK